MQRIIIFANGELPDLEKARSIVRTGDYIICADGGTRHASLLGLRPDLIIGDLDSANSQTINEFRQAGVQVEAHSQDKNETDLELAIQRAIDLNCIEIIIIGALGGRLDQTLANIALLAGALNTASDLRLDDGVEEILLCRDQAAIAGRSGDIVSLIPWQGTVLGVETSGLKWPLQKETLHPQKTRGVSNEMTGESASVSISAGLLLVVHRRQL